MRFKDLPDEKIVLKISNGMDFSKITISATIAEGFSIFVQKDILEKELEVAKKLQRKLKARAIRRELSSLKEHLRVLKAKNSIETIFVLDGVNIMKSLYELLGGDADRLIDFVLTIDFAQTNGILYADPEYDTMVEDPLLLPRAA